MGCKTDSFYGDVLNQEIVEAINNDFGKAVLRLPNQGRGEVSEEVYRAVRPMLAVSQGSLWLMSTPYGKRGFFYDAWARGRGG